VAIWVLNSRVSIRVYLKGREQRMKLMKRVMCPSRSVGKDHEAIEAKQLCGVLPWQRPRSPYWHARLLASDPLFLDAARVQPPKPCLQRNVLALSCPISETQHYRTRSLLTLIPINLTLPRRLNNLPRRQIGLDGLTFLGFT